MADPSRTVHRLTTSGSAAGGFAWSSDQQFEATVDCVTFDAHVAASITDRFTISIDADGTITRTTQSIAAPRVVWTNTKTGTIFVTAGHYLQVADRIPGTHEFNRRITGTGSAMKGEVDNELVVSASSALEYEQHFADAVLTRPATCTAIT